MNETFRPSSTTRTLHNIHVYVRIRPLNNDQDQPSSCILDFTDKTVSVRDRDSKQPHSYTFDGIFPPSTKQTQVYKTVCSDMIYSAANGINGTIFCYGQTSSGKTYTCVGPDFIDREQCGIIPRLIKDTLKIISKNPKNIESQVKLSMVEIYNEKIRDLLDSSKSNIKIRSNKKQGIYLENMTQKYLLENQAAFQYLATGLSNRSVCATNMNDSSSRSHMIVIVNLSTHDVLTGEAKSAKLILVDLAGSQKISKSGAEGKQLEETKKINTSLTALGKVIIALSDRKTTHIPYRDSKLTHLLQESLGGNSITKLIINVSSCLSNQSETIMSFRFGSRAKYIKNEPIVNKMYTVDELLKLLKKAEETIKMQNSVIQNLESKKKVLAGISVPFICTLNFIPDNDDQSEQDSEPSHHTNEKNSSIWSIEAEQEQEQKNDLEEVATIPDYAEKPEIREMTLDGCISASDVFNIQSTSKGSISHRGVDTDEAEDNLRAIKENLNKLKMYLNKNEHEKQNKQNKTKKNKEDIIKAVKSIQFLR